MAKKIFIWVAHPKTGSLCSAMADAYQEGAKAKGAEIRRMNLSDMQFDMNFEGYASDMPDLEPDLVKWQEAVTWADHLLFIHPYWWGAMPTKAKAVLDRALTPGFAFKYHGKTVAWDKLLKGKTADAVITSDTPPWLDTTLYLKPGRRVLKNQVFDFCGIKAKTIRQFGSVKMAGEERIAKWIAQTGQMGMKAAA
ncbi:MAG: NAD(P)H-dependent oxidoreductase [Pseudomonadota bacterium]